VNLCEQQHQQHGDGDDGDGDNVDDEFSSPHAEMEIAIGS